MSDENSDKADEEDFRCEFCEEEFETDKELKKHHRLEHERKTCSQCGKKLSHMPSECNYCGETLCKEHRLPEKHDCVGLEEGERRNKDKIMFMNSKKDGSETSKVEQRNLSSNLGKKLRSKTYNIGSPINFESLKKLLPILGILLLGVMYGTSGSNDINSISDLQQLDMNQKLVNAYDSLKNSIEVGDKTKLGTTLILIITIWSTFKYWLKDIKVIKKNSGLLEKVLTIIILLIIAERHIVLESTLGYYADWAIFLMTVYVELAGSWFLAKTIDNIDLSSDLYCWGLRILGILTMLFGALLFTSSSLVAFSSDLVFSNIYWIGSVCLIGLGAFMEYRSFRRHPAIHVWQ